MKPVQLKIYTNTDDAFLVWTTAAPIADCLGFCIERTWVASNVTGHPLGVVQELNNSVGFADAGDPDIPVSRPSSVWPFQRFNWTDHSLSFGDRAQYRVVPMCGPAPDHLAKRADQASDWVDATSQHPVMGKLAFFQNRSMAVSQWMARYAKAHHFQNASAMVAAVGNLDEQDLRRELGGPVYLALCNLLESVAEDPALEVWAALYELTDRDIVARFGKLGQRAHMILANGSWKAERPDENAAAAASLAGVIDLHRRMMTSSIQVHNKFIVVTRGGIAKQVWTGSTNLTPTGLFTQSNNALFIESDALADQYLKQWHRLQTAGNDPPSSLAQGNPAPAPAVTAPAAIEVWFTATKAKRDLTALRELVNQAAEGLLFLTYMPGDSGPLLDVLKRRRTGLYVRGVINQFVGDKLKVELKGGSDSDPMDLDAVSPGGLAEQMSYWAAEYNRGGTLSVLVHSKVICIDPFGAKPVVVTGSHNFSDAASGTNDDNFVVIRNRPDVAKAYATYIIGVYQQYRWVQYVAKKRAAGENPWHKLDSTPAWMPQRLANAGERREREFWLGIAPSPH